MKARKLNQLLISVCDYHCSAFASDDQLWALSVEVRAIVHRKPSCRVGVAVAYQQRFRIVSIYDPAGGPPGRHYAHTALRAAEGRCARPPRYPATARAPRARPPRLPGRDPGPPGEPG